MATYAIGDIQGCYSQLLALLKKINFNKNDKLWLTGDIVNRGPESLQTLRFIKELNENHQAILVLGNHDLGMLAIARGAEKYIASQHTFIDIIKANDKENLLSWLEKQPLLYHEKIKIKQKDADIYRDFTLVHAGIYPEWSLSEAIMHAEEVSTVLKSSAKMEFYQHLYGNLPNQWAPHLKGFDRLRFIVNAFTRMRFCTLEGQLDLETKEMSNHQQNNYYPWFKVPHRKTADCPIIFGHWAALEGKCDAPLTYALDTGCVWGGCLTALRLEDGQSFNVKC